MTAGSGNDQLLDGITEVFARYERLCRRLTCVLSAMQRVVEKRWPDEDAAEFDSFLEEEERKEGVFEAEGSWRQ